MLISFWKSSKEIQGGFAHGGWAMPLLGTEAGEHINEVYGGAAAFLFGRRTYEIFAGSWGAIPEMSTSPIGAALNSRRTRKCLKHIRGRCRIGAGVFVAGVRGRPGGAPRTTGDDPRCSTWFP